MTAASDVRVIDARGHRCPTPSLRLRRALADAPVGATVRLLSDDAMARIDVPHLLSALGDALISVDEVEGVLTFEVRKGQPR